MRPRQNGGHLPDDLFQCIFFNENVSISITISLKIILKGPINTIPSSVQKMAWRQPGDKPLSEPMMVRLPTLICITRPQLVHKRHPPTSPCWPKCRLSIANIVEYDALIVTALHPMCNIYQIELSSTNLPQEKQIVVISTNRRHRCIPYIRSSWHFWPETEQTVWSQS